MEQKTLYDFEAKCVQDEAPACQSSCPLHVDARTFVKLMREGQVTKARQLLDKALPLSCLTVYLCEGVCKNACRVCELPLKHDVQNEDNEQSREVANNSAHKKAEGVNINLLERACVANTPRPRIMPLPNTRKKIALIGGGLSSLILAFELNKKGHPCTIYHTHELGADILSTAKGVFSNTFYQDVLKKGLEEALGILQTIKVTFTQISEISEEFLNSCLDDESENYRAVFLSYDDSSVQASDIFSDKNTNFYTPDSISLVTQNQKVLCGAFNISQTPFIQSIADGKRAAGSIERIMQGVNPSISREKEGAQHTKLYTNLEGLETSPHIIPKDFSTPSLEEAKEEAKRCIECSCLECVKECTYLAHYKSYPKRYLREMYNNLAIVKGTRTANTMINSCTQCGLCEKVCPKDLNMGEFIDMARKELVSFKRMPPSAHEFALDDMISTFHKDVQFIRYPQNFDSLQTPHTLQNLNNLQNLDSQKNKQYMFFSGCQLPAVLPYEVEAVYTHLTKYISVGFHFACCGIPAKWAGNEQLLTQVLANFNKKWEEAEKPIYIFACSSCAEFFKEHCPELEQISLWEVLAKLPLPEHFNNTLSNNLVNGQHSFIIHDPCSVREFPQTYTAIRDLLSTMQQETFELPFSKELSRCCGNGGLSAEVNPKVADTFVLNRIEDLKETPTNNNILLVYCAICRERYQKQGQSALHILELLFNKEVRDLQNKINLPLLKIYERQENRTLFRTQILKNIFNEEINQEEKDMQTFLENIQLNISEDVEKILDERRILRTDILKVIFATMDTEQVKTLKIPHSNEFNVENTSVFQNATNKHCLAAYRPRQVTFWVEFLLEDNASYTIFDAYSHRMIVPGVHGEGKEALYKNCCVDK